MSSHKKRKKLEKHAVAVTATRVSDFPNAPPLLALMRENEIARTVKNKNYKDVADGHD